MEKVLHIFEIFETPFYFKFFELEKVTFGAVKVKVIQMEFESILNWIFKSNLTVNERHCGPGLFGSQAAPPPSPTPCHHVAPSAGRPPPYCACLTEALPCRHCFSHFSTPLVLLGHDSSHRTPYLLSTSSHPERSRHHWIGSRRCR
jgi:hypothetical protein